MNLKESGTTMKLWRKTSAVSFAAKKSPERGVSSPYFSRTKPPSGLAGESNVTAPSSVCEATFSRGRTCWVLQEKVPLAKKPRDRISRLNKSDKADNCFFTRDIKEQKVRFKLTLIDRISSDGGSQTNSSSKRNISSQGGNCKLLINMVFNVS